MRTCHCHEDASSNSANRARVAVGDPRPTTLAGRCRNIAEWLAPTGTLLLLPKCPACLAAYLAIGTGIGISVSAAAYLRTALVTVCIASLSYLAAGRGCRFIALIAKSH